MGTDVVFIVLGGWLLWDLLVVLGMAWIARRGRRRRPPCPVVDLQTVALERARRGAARGQKQEQTDA